MKRDKSVDIKKRRSEKLYNGMESFTDKVYIASHAVPRTSIFHL